MNVWNIVNMIKKTETKRSSEQQELPNKMLK